MLPVGFANSSLTMTRAEPGGTTRTSSTSGVFPMPDNAPRETASTTLLTNAIDRQPYVDCHGDARCPTSTSAELGPGEDRAHTLDQLVELAE